MYHLAVQSLPLVPLSLVKALRKVYLLFGLAYNPFQPFLMSDASDVLRYARWCVAARRSRAVVLASVLGDVAKRAAGPAAVDATLSASERTA